jgi:two-component system chemotaxis response regulator CheY
LVDRSIRILIVDDDMLTLRVLSAMLQQLGFRNLDEATSGRAALIKLAARTFDLVLCDWHMQPMSGIELLKELRANPKTQDLPFVMVTSDAKAESVEAARAAGVSEYLVKPITVETLKAKLAGILGPL